MTMKTMPRPVADAIAHFVVERVRLNQEPWTSDREERTSSYLSFVAHYQRAVAFGYEVTADNLAHALLEIAVHHQDAPGFKAAWREWQQVGPALEDEPRQ